MEAMSKIRRYLKLIESCVCEMEGEHIRNHLKICNNPACGDKAHLSDIGVEASKRKRKQGGPVTHRRYDAGCCCPDCDSAEDKQKRAELCLHFNGLLVDPDFPEYTQLEAQRRVRHLEKCIAPLCNDPAHGNRSEAYAKVADSLIQRKDKPTKVHTSLNGLPDIDHPAGCGCEVCRNIRNVELARRERERDKGREHFNALADKEHRPRPVWLNDKSHLPQCTCKKCMAAKKEARGCGPQCGCVEETRDNISQRDRRLRVYEDNPHPVSCDCDICLEMRAKDRGCKPQCGCSECVSNHYFQRDRDNTPGCSCDGCTARRAKAQMRRDS